MEQKYIFSVIMPTLNSERTLERALNSLRSQDFPQEKIELLVIDGGSTDKTIDIAKKYKAKILDNPQKVPEAAKRIGLIAAKGIWIIEQDSDEEYSDSGQLMRRYNFLKERPSVFCYVTDVLKPGKRCGISCSYLNYVGDPFGYIVYRNRGGIVQSYKRNLLEKYKEGNVYSFKAGDNIPIGDGGTTTINIQKARELFGTEVETEEFASSIFWKMVIRTKLVACIPEDYIIHHSSAHFKDYLNKTKFKIVMNLNDDKKFGYSSRTSISKTLSRRKLLFIFYCITVIGPIASSIKLAIKFKDMTMLLHFFYTYYIVINIAYELIRKRLHLKSKNSLYGKR